MMDEKSHHIEHIANEVVYTDNSKEYTGKKVSQYVAGLTASLAALSMGTTLAWTSQISENLLNDELGFPISKAELGWIGSIMCLGAATLSLFAVTLSDFIGRKILMLVLILPATAGWSLLIWAKNVGMLYGGRFLTGMIAGAFCILASIYSSEIAEKEIRGALGSFTQLMISCGILFANVIAKFLDIRPYTIVCAAVPLVFGVLFLFMPESPVYLIKTNKISEARKVLSRLRGKNYNIDKGIFEIEESLKEHRTYSGLNVIKKSLKKWSSQKACIIGLGLMIFKSANGMDAVTAYTAMIFTSTRMGLDPKIGTIILNVVQVISAVVHSLVVDRFGRRMLLWLSATTMSICLAVVGVILLLKNRNLISEESYTYVAYLPLIAFIVYMVSFSLGLGPIPWLMMGEIFPQEIKSIAASFASFISWIAAFAVTRLFPMIEDSWGAEIGFFIFSGCTAAAIVFTVVLVPETKSKTINEIQAVLAR